MVIAQNHNYFKVGKYPGCKDWQSGSIPDDVHVDDYVWIGANVTLCPGVHIPRGCIVAAGSVCVKSREYLPYTVIGGNPAKMIKYRLSLEEQLEQENLVVPPPERIPEGVLRHNWNKFMRHTQRLVVQGVNFPCDNAFYGLIPDRCFMNIKNEVYQKYQFNQIIFNILKQNNNQL